MHTPISKSMMRLISLASVLSVLQACMDVAGLPVDRQTSAEHSGASSNRGAAVPARGFEGGRRFSQLADDSLWTLIAAGDGRAVIGLKTPGEPRGVYKSDILISESNIEVAAQSLRAIPGLEILSQDTLLPMLIVRLRDLPTLSRVRKLPFLDYINPDRISGFIFADGTGCTELPWSGSTVYSPSGDVVPYLYGTVIDTWTRSNGAGITIGLVDTGIFVNSQQMRLPYFASGESTSRSIRYLNTGNFTSPYAECSHGTRMAGIMTAPRDGQDQLAWLGVQIS